METAGNLPSELTGFVGRVPELDRLTALVTGSRLATVTGAGGVGKTRLALHAARRLQDRFRDGVRFVELIGLHGADLVDHTVAEALRLPDHTSRAPREALAEHLADRELLLVLDGFDRLAEPCAALVADLLRRAPGLRVLAVGRRPLGITGELLLPLEPLPVASDAVRLFTERAAAVVPGFAVTAANSAAVAELCSRLDGLPLALELAAVRLRALSVEQVLDRLDDRFRLLTGGDPSAPARHRALRTAIGWSHELCSPAERLLWARLSVFAGRFDLEAVEYVCAGSGIAEPEVVEAVAALVAQSVLSREEDGEGGHARYRMLDSVREYGAGWLAELGEEARVRRRHRDWYLGLATWCELDWFSPRQAEVAARVAADLPNLRLALEFSLDGILGEPAEDPAVGQYLAGTLWFCWVGCGRLAEGRHWLGRALELPAEHSEARAKAMWVYGYVALLQGDSAAALSVLQQCRDEARAAGNAVAEAYALHRLGCLALVSDDMPRAERFIDDALLRYRSVGELNSNVLMAQVELAMSVAFQGDVEQAVRLAEEVRDICRDHGERWTLAYALYVLGYAAWLAGEPGRARRLAEESLAIDHAFDDLVGAVLALELLALITEGEGAPYEAAVLQGAAGRLWGSVGLRLFGSRYFNAPHAVCEQRVRAALGETAYTAALGEGALLGLDAAAHRALNRPRGPLRGEQRAVPRTPAPRTHEPAASPEAAGQ
ncbi:tetratricopeptide repeat protein [Streptomyces cocklensis]|jgi:predicted ATPase|uniref:Predicted ATPase n=1 Tax=Actinacidiphila cocklensis TaxID=887465 RepID=A0A9W4DV23_9ACTN|nr:tetratricopeptide repeat protein [Actinacidiphila cocklensis]MDD1058967.1 tetratricopeptide repeat protein [Actinacidiphila cocklensis]CAG6394467.1 Predicted ATPase [Actinacidiphila cocklensis]